MYKVITTDNKVLTTTGKNLRPTITLENEFNDRAQIVEDDGCYVLYLATRVGTYNIATHWFKEATIALYKYYNKVKDNDKFKELETLVELSQKEAVRKTKPKKKNEESVRSNPV